MFEKINRGPTDQVLALKFQADNDRAPSKLDLGAGVYRDENGRYHEYRSIAKAKKILDAQNLGHDYETPTGIADFTRLARELIFGETSPVLSKTCSVQTISGSGAVHLGAVLMSRAASEHGRLPLVFYGAPGWNNYEKVFQYSGFKIEKLPYYDFATRDVSFAAFLDGIRQAPEGSIIILQGCSQNPTAADLTNDQWREVAQVMKARDHFPFFDVAYYGLADGLDEDAFSWRLFTQMGFDMVVCQSFSKNFGLYGERVGALHVICPNDAIVANIKSELFSIIRSEYSTNPLYGARLVTIVLSDANLRAEWQGELAEMRARLKGLRRGLVSRLEQLETPGDWSYINKEKGLFSLLPLTPQDCQEFKRDHHVYLLPSGRVNISGLNQASVGRFAALVDRTVRKSLGAESKAIGNEPAIEVGSTRAAVVVK